MLNSLSTMSTYAIVAVGAVHVAFLCLLWILARRDFRKIASSLDDFTRGLRHRSILDATSHLSEQIDAFLADVNEVLDKPPGSNERVMLLHRINVLDEKRGYLRSLSFETSYNICRSMIEAYPLAGVLGTVLAIGAALQVSSQPGAVATVGSIVVHFGEAIWSTFAGLAIAIVLMFLNSIVETPFRRLSENREHVREMIVRVKRELSLNPQEQG